MVNISDLRFVSLDDSGEVTVSFVEQPSALVQMLLDARWLPQITAEIPRLEDAAKRDMAEFHVRFRELMAACEGY